MSDTAQMAPVADLLLRGDLAASRSAAESLLRANSGHAPAWHLLGLIAARENNIETAISHLERAVEQDPLQPHWWRDLGLLLLAQAKASEASVALGRALQWHPEESSLWKVLAAALLVCDRCPESLDASHRAYTLGCCEKENVLVMAKALTRLKRFADASAILEALLEANPEWPQAHAAIADVYSLDGRPHLVLWHREAAWRSMPQSRDAQAKLSAACWDNGDLARTIDLIEPLITNGAATPSEHSFYLSALLHQSGQTRTSIRQAHQAWAAAHTRMVRRFLDYSNNRDPERRIRVGYIGGDLFDNPSLYFLLPFLRNHDHAVMEVYGYDIRCRNDHGTAQARTYFHQWRPCRNLSDTEILDLIRADQIDVLVDTTGHFRGHRLHLLAHRPAPVQVALLNYPATTGLDCFDGIITDPWVCPPGEDDQYWEPACRLKSGFLSYALPESAPPLTPLPALENGFVTFGLFQRPVKIGREVWDAVAAVLHRSPGSRLLIHNAFPQLESADSYMRRLYERELHARRIEPQRLRFAAPTNLEAHLRILSEADVALDTFPYNGQTTTCECLWMGVPVVTRTGELHVARVGRSVLHRAGFPDWDTKSTSEYVNLASALAGDLSNLRKTRAGMRARVADSLLLDGRKITTELENTYRALWKRWCLGETTLHA